MVRLIRSAQLKDNLRQIRFTLNRYIAILLITALGVAFLAGLRATGPDMRATTENYLKGHRFMDLRVVSTLGLDDDDLKAIAAAAGVSAVQPGYFADVLALLGDRKMSVTLHSWSADDAMNAPELTEGRLPQASGECLADPRLLGTMGLKLGDTIQLASGTDDALGDTIRTDRYVVVGIARNPAYLSHDRGTSTVGSGRSDGYLLIPTGDFTLEVHTEAALRVEAAASRELFSQGYLDALQPVKDALKAAGATRTELRYADVISEAQQKLADAKGELADGKQELADGRQKLTDARTDLDKGWQDYRDGQKEYDDKMADAQQKLDDGQKQYDSGLAQYRSGVKELEKARADTKAQLDAAQGQLDAGQRQYEDGLAQYEQGKAASDGLTAALAAGPAPQAVAAVGAIAQGLQATSPELAAVLQAYVANPADPVAAATAQGAAAQFAQTLAQTKAQLDAAALELTTQGAALAQGRAAAQGELAAGEKKLEEAKAKLDKAKRTLAANRDKLAQGRADGQKELDDALQKLQDGESEYADGLREYDDKLPDAQQKIADGEKEIADGEKKLAKLKKPDWFILDREANVGVVSLRQDAERMDAIGTVIPMLFFLVVVLVTMTSMTRLVESDRGIIGTYKALGYTNMAIARRYLVYAVSASLVGGVAGLFVGLNLFPRVIFNAYSYLYAIPNLYIGYYPSTAVLSLVTAVLSTAVPALLVCLRSLRCPPADLIRPQAPHGGKRILLERFTLLWRRMNFSQKVSMRNLFRYKKRGVMTVLGVAFCTALMFTGFGLQDAITTVGTLQYQQIATYDVQVALQDDAADADRDAALAAVRGNALVTHSSTLHRTTVDASAHGVTKTAMLATPLDDNFSDTTHLRTRVGHRPLALGDDGAVISEKLSQLLGLRPGDALELKDEDGNRAQVKVTAVAENYLNHFVYVSPALYQRLWGETPVVNQVLCALGSGDRDALAAALLDTKGVSSITFISTVKDTIDKTINALQFVVLVLIVSAALLLFVVLFSLNTINLEERRREMATIKVLGFFDGELAAYLYRENVVLTVVGALLGLGLGFLLQRYVIVTVELDFLMFGRDILWSSYLYALGLTFAFAAIVNLGMLRSFKRIDMVSSLKSVE